MKVWKRDFDDTPNRTNLQREFLKAGSEASFELKKSPGSMKSSSLQPNSPSGEKRPSVQSFALESGKSMQPSSAAFTEPLVSGHLPGGRSRSMCMDLLSKPLVLGHPLPDAAPRFQKAPLVSNRDQPEISRRSESDEELIKKYLRPLQDCSITDRPFPNRKSDWTSSLVDLQEEDVAAYRNFNLRKVKGPVEIRLDISQEKAITPNKETKESEASNRDNSLYFPKRDAATNDQPQETQDLSKQSKEKLPFSKQMMQKLTSSIQQFKRDSGLTSASDLNSYLVHRKTKTPVLALGTEKARMEPIKEIPEQGSTSRKQIKQPATARDPMVLNDSLNIARPAVISSPKKESKEHPTITFGKLLTRDTEKLKLLSNLEIHSRRSNLKLSEIRNLRKVGAVH